MLAAEFNLVGSDSDEAVGTFAFYKKMKSTWSDC